MTIEDSPRPASLTGAARKAPPPRSRAGAVDTRAGGGAAASARAAAIRSRSGPIRRLWHRVSGLVPYGPGIRMQVAGLRLRRWFRTRELVEATHLLRGILPPDTDADRLADAAVGCLLCARFTGWRNRALMRVPPERLDRVACVHGLEALHALRDTGRGFMIVNSKFGAAEAVPLLLTRFGYTLWSLEGASHLDMAGLPGIVRVLEIARCEPRGLRELRAAVRLLQDGNVLHLAGNGEARGGGLVLPFLGRARRFPEGFAYLAVHTGCPAVPVFSRISASGRIDVEILPPLPSGPDGARPGERVVLMLKAYAQLLEQMWMVHPGSIGLGELRRFAKLPLLDGGSAL